MAYNFGDKGCRMARGDAAWLHRSAAVGLGLTAALMAPEALAQSMSDEIVVTAQRREQSLQDVPMAVSAFGAQELESRGITDAQSLMNAIPNATFSSNVGNLQVNIRGVGETWSLNPAADTAVAFYIDNVYQSRPVVGNSDDFYSDLERVEVLRGPQGTLYGRNSTGGVVHLITRAPTDELEVTARVRYETFDSYGIGLGVSGPMGENAAGSLRIAHSGANDGSARNVFLGHDLNVEDSTFISGQFRANLGESVEMILRADSLQRDIDGPFDQWPAIVTPLAGGGGLVSTDVRETYSNLLRETEVKSHGASLELTWDAGNVTLRSITAYRDTENNTDGLDFDGTQLPIAFTNPHEHGDQITQEFLLTSNDWERVDLTAGVFLLQENYDATLATIFGATPVSQVLKDGETFAAGIFADLTYHFNDQWSLTGGVRLNHEEKSRTAIVCQGLPLDQCTREGAALLGPAGAYEEAEIESTEPTGRVVLSYQPNDNLMLFGSASRGFRAGGFNNAGTGGFDPEFIWSYELGLKSRPAPGLQLNVSGFFYDYSDVIVQRITLLGTQFENAAAATYKGVELEGVWSPNEFLTIDGQVSYLDGQFDEFETQDNFTGAPLDLAGSRTPRSPEMQAHIGVQLDFPAPGGGAFLARYDWRWSDEYKFEHFDRAETNQPAFDLHDLRFGYTSPSERWEAALYVRNVADEDYLVKATTVGAPVNTALVGYAQPRVVGASLSLRY